MRIRGNSGMSIWLSKLADSMEAGHPPPRTAPLGEYIEPSIMDEISNHSDFEGSIQELYGLDPESVKRMNDNVLKAKERGPGEPLVDMRMRPRAIPPSAKRRIQNKVHDLTIGFKDTIPLKAIFDALESEGVFPVQEDGASWEGMLLGGSECGSEEARAQRAHIDLAVRLPDWSFALSTAKLHISWCKLGGQYEITAYVA